MKLVSEVLEVVTLYKNEDYYNQGKGVSNQIQVNILQKICRIRVMMLYLKTCPFEPLHTMRIILN